MVVKTDEEWSGRQHSDQKDSNHGLQSEFKKERSPVHSIRNRRAGKDCGTTSGWGPGAVSG